MTWKLWYADGSTFSSEDGEPWESPPWGVVCVTQEVKGSQVLDAGRDYYIWLDDLQQWLEVDPVGLVDYVTNRAPHVLCVRPGRMLNSVDVMAIYRTAREDRCPH